MLDRLRNLAPPTMDVGEGANGGQVLGRAAQDLLELDRRRVELADFDQGAAQRDARGNIRGVPQQPRAASLDRVGEHAEAPVLLGESGEGDRRRVPLDPALQFLDSRRVGHDGHHQVTG